MKNKKGFTLIELLAVIIILAVIALIATPIVLNVVDNARKSANKDSAYGLLDSAKLYYIEGLLDESKSLSGNLIDKINVSGRKPNSGKLYINSKGETALAVVYDKVCFMKNYSETDLTESDDIENCTISSDTKKYTVYSNGTVIYYNPETNTKCSESEATLNVSENGMNGMPTGVKTGCMKWYTFNDSNGSKIVNMILDHNTTMNVNYDGTSVGLINADIAQLKNDTSSWNNTLNVKLISANEIAKITGNTNFNSDVSTWLNGRFFFETNTWDAPNPSIGTYKWLYDNITDCINYECKDGKNVVDSFGYVTSSLVKDASSSVWVVRASGTLNGDDSVHSTFGIRPVITVSKDIIS